MKQFIQSINQFPREKFYYFIFILTQYFKCRSNCYCDEEFQSCLRSVNSKTSTSVAKLYFNLIQVQCFRKDHPILKCLEYKGYEKYKV